MGNRFGSLTLHTPITGSAGQQASSSCKKNKGHNHSSFSKEKMGFRLSEKISYLNMNSSSAPANNENVAYGPLLAQAGKLKRADQVNLVRALAGQLGMIAMFPAQLQGGVANSSGPAKGGPKEKKKKGPAKQAASNPLSGSPEKAAFDAAKKAVAKATKEAGGQKLAGDHPLVRALESAKDQYFRALSSAKGQKSEDADASSDEEEAGPSAPPPTKSASPSKTVSTSPPAAQPKGKGPAGSPKKK